MCGVFERTSIVLLLLLCLSERELLSEKEGTVIEFILRIGIAQIPITYHRSDQIDRYSTKHT